MIMGQYYLYDAPTCQRFVRTNTGFNSKHYDRNKTATDMGSIELDALKATSVNASYQLAA